MSEIRDEFINGECPTIYGPVQSKRHGLSLGINLGNPSTKVCSWGCVYCQCGFANRSADTKGHGVPHPDAVMDALRLALKMNPKIEAVTIAGNSEPTMYPWFFELANGIKKLQEVASPRWKSIVLSNASGIFNPENIEACNLFDEVWVKLDCATEALFARLNRPYQTDLSGHIERLGLFPNLKIQTLLWTADDEMLSNSCIENLDALTEKYLELKPDVVHLTTISRGTALTGLKPLMVEELQRFRDGLVKLGINAHVYM